MLNKTQYLPAAMIALQAASAVPYLIECDWRKCAYWLFAAGLTITVTF